MGKQAPVLPAIATAFVRKLYRILDRESAAVIAWDADGASFVILDPDALETHVLPRYFHGRLSTFRQQLKEHSFTACVADQGHERYRHPLFRRGCPELLNLITHSPLPRKRPPRKKKRKQSETDAAAASTSELEVVKSSVDRGVHRVSPYPARKEPEPEEFKHAKVDSAALASNPLFAEDEPPLSELVQGLVPVGSLSTQPMAPTTPSVDGLLSTKKGSMPDDVMEALLSLLSTSLSTDGREVVAAASGAGANSTSSTGSHNIFAEGRPPVVLPPLPPGIVENGQFSDDTLNGLMRWASANGTSSKAEDGYNCNLPPR
ncbi:hypothetical protein PF005_g20092 [Phytophthora fragariae]|uniref:HSF-type DNA-binding domain-containing protein n=1 Tax=Phytophthora fragariae TaxID=53985 RepID=A0A6A3J4J8_9STRA|nr:hypothetical protein PF003_g11740 [Phytophthora fragariae]KAE8928894.1 hypothetical protein PF009_g20979 [Phytophthora fragariae]KAE8989202.1 hypothetical protein PF011_g18867 [Phytophthora fragariae]KAE9088093.1 hypothetical protein PF007_g20108 [Phytophthora fragariae]KAE9088179.1 hypothetical protein PF010_g19459 [Phytophthora fragariae]